MSIQEYLEKIKSIQKYTLQYLDHEDKTEEDFYNLINEFQKQRIENDNYSIKLVLTLLVKIANNHFRYPNFFQKIEKIILFFEDEIRQDFEKYEIFDIFKSNKRLLLFVFERKFITINDRIISVFSKPKYKSEKYPEYFMPEINEYNKSNPEYKQQEIPENFEEKRKIGENDDYICEIVRKDLVEEFITYVMVNEYPLDSDISLSIYETNPFIYKIFAKNSITPLLNKQDTVIKLIEYASFFGSTQIIKYMISKETPLTESLWLYSVHSDSPEMIQILVENNIYPPYYLYKKPFVESIRCHNNDIINYLQSNFLEYEKDIEKESIKEILKYYNFGLIQSEFINQNLMGLLVKYNYMKIVELLMQNSHIDINDYTVFTFTIFNLVFKKIIF